jgi:ferrochelatase
MVLNTGLRDSAIPSFYNEPAYVELMARLVEEKVAADLAAAHLPSQTGIVLMNHGCPTRQKDSLLGLQKVRHSTNRCGNS